MQVRCKRCGFVDDSLEFILAHSLNHDLRCPRCNSIDLDTSALLKAVPNYAYGPDNCLKLTKTAGGKG